MAATEKCICAVEKLFFSMFTLTQIQEKRKQSVVYISQNKLSNITPRFHCWPAFNMSMALLNFRVYAFMDDADI